MNNNTDTAKSVLNIADLRKEYLADNPMNRQQQKEVYQHFKCLLVDPELSIHFAQIDLDQYRQEIEKLLKAFGQKYHSHAMARPITTEYPCEPDKLNLEELAMAICFWAYPKPVNNPTKEDLANPCRMLMANLRHTQHYVLLESSKATKLVYTLLLLEDLCQEDAFDTVHDGLLPFLREWWEQHNHRARIPIHRNEFRSWITDSLRSGMQLVTLPTKWDLARIPGTNKPGRKPSRKPGFDPKPYVRTQSVPAPEDVPVVDPVVALETVQDAPAPVPASIAVQWDPEAEARHILEVTMALTEEDAKSKLDLLITHLQYLQTHYAVIKQYHQLQQSLPAIWQK